MMSYAIMLAVIVVILAVVAIMGPFVVVNTIIRPILGLYLVVTVFVVETALVRVPPCLVGSMSTHMTLFSSSSPPAQSDAFFGNATVT